MKKNVNSLLRSCAVAFAALGLWPAYGQDAAPERILVTTEEAQAMYDDISMQRASVHDPSIVYDEASGYYYIFGSHIATAKTRDLQNWTWVNLPWGTVGEDGAVTSGVPSSEAFRTNQTREITIRGEKVAFGNFDAAGWSCALPGGEGQAWTVDGNMWAPDIFYNPVMKKWCEYLSLNGPTWNSCIVLLTADRIEGPYVYQGPVVYTGFRNDTDERISFHKTDLELVIGEQQTLPARYNQEESWGSFWPHAIDPCVFYDEEGTLWMSYGSWSGGIYMLQLDEATGLRDYDVAYPGDFDTKKQNATSDPYFGKKIAGGWYVSGEGSYIERIGDYYYLFMSYGGLNSDGGYEMRVFRSERPDGPYKGPDGTDAVFDRYLLNFGPNADNRGEKLLGAYRWGLMDVGECAQGHNSVLAAEDGNTYLVYHTRFNDGTEGHQVRVHQLFLNASGWPVAAPFEYHGETVGDAELASAQMFSAEEIAGPYKILVHRYNLDHARKEEVTPVEITLHADGTVDGAYTGRWEVYDGNSYITLELGGVAYEGVVVEQQVDPTTIKAVCFTACAKDGVNVWGYRMEDPYALAYTLNTYARPVTEGQNVTRHLDLYGMKVENPVQVRWSSDAPDIISHTGRYNPAGLEGDAEVSLTAELSAGNYYWTNVYHVTAREGTVPSGDWKTGIQAYYGFDREPFVNPYDEAEEAVLLSQGGARKPSLELDSLRTGHILHQYFGASGNCSYVRIPNPLRDMDLEGMTVSLWVKRTDEVPWDAIWSFYDPASDIRLYLTGNSYVGFNNGAGDWMDLNHPNAVVSDNIPVGEWCLVTLTLSREGGLVLYINNGRVRDWTCAGTCHGAEVTSAKDFDYDMVMDFIQSCPDFYLGYGSFWGSVDVRLDDLIFYSRDLSSGDVRALNTMANRVTDFADLENGSSVEGVKCVEERPSNGMVYDLSGRPVRQMKKGIYIVGGKKVLRP